MIKKIIRKIDFSQSGPAQGLAFRLSRTPGECLDAVELLKESTMEIQKDFKELPALLHAAEAACRAKAV